jgi:hypothetical protein
MADFDDEMQQDIEDLERFGEDVSAVFGSRSSEFSGQLKGHLHELWSRAQGKQTRWDFRGEDEEPTGNVVLDPDKEPFDKLLIEMLGGDD